MFTGVGVEYYRVSTTQGNRMHFVHCMYLLYSFAFPPPPSSRRHGHTYLDTPLWVGLLCMGDQPDAKTLPDNTYKTFLPTAGFEPTIPSSERPQTHTLDRTVAAIGLSSSPSFQKLCSPRPRSVLLVAAQSLSASSTAATPTSPQQRHI